MTTCTLIDYLRSPKILDMALFDWLASLLFAFIIGRYMIHIRTVIQWIVWIILWIAFGVVVHIAVGVPTMFGYYLGLNARPPRKECKSMIE